MNYLRAAFLLMATSWTIAARAQTTDEYFVSKGVKIHYAKAGAGETVVLIHGWMGDSSMWGRDAKGNTQLDTSGLPGFQGIAIDCRGHGKSDKPHDPTKYGLEMAEDVVRLLDHLKIKKAHLVGYSMGAFIVGKIVAKHPKRVLSVIYGGQSPIIKGEISSGPSEVEIFAKAVAEGNGLGPYILAMTPPDRPKPTLDQANAIAKYLYGDKDVEAFVAAGRSLDKLEVTFDQLRKAKVPTMFIYGSKESDRLKERVATFRREVGSGELKVIEGTDHVTTLAKPQFGKSIVEFLLAHRSHD